MTVTINQRKSFSLLKCTFGAATISLTATRRTATKKPFRARKPFQANRATWPSDLHRHFFFVVARRGARGPMRSPPDSLASRPAADFQAVLWVAVKLASRSDG